jgi:phage RecT family recombinase
LGDVEGQIIKTLFPLKSFAESLLAFMRLKSKKYAKMNLIKVKEKVTELAIDQFKDVYGPEAESRLRQEIGFMDYLIKSNKSLQTCTPDSLGFSLCQAAILGLSIMPSRKEAYIVPFGGKANLLVGYQGEINLRYREGIITSAQARVVYEHDNFEWLETEKGVTYKYHASDKKGKESCAFAVFTLPNKRVVGRRILPKDWAPREALSRGGFWKGVWRPEMIMKTALRMGWHGLPTTPLIDRLNNAESWMQKKEAIEVEVEDVRLEEIQKQVKKAKTKQELSMLFRAIPQHERNSPEVVEIFTEQTKTIEK